MNHSSLECKRYYVIAFCIMYRSIYVIPKNSILYTIITFVKLCRTCPKQRIFQRILRGGYRDLIYPQIFQANLYGISRVCSGKDITDLLV